MGSTYREQLFYTMLEHTSNATSKPLSQFASLAFPFYEHVGKLMRVFLIITSLFQISHQACSQTSCLTCTISNGQEVCTLCNAGYYISQTLMNCNACRESCLRCSSLNSCQTCIQGFYLNQDSCVICPAGCSSCDATGMCTACQTNCTMNSDKSCSCSQDSSLQTPASSSSFSWKSWILIFLVIGLCVLGIAVVAVIHCYRTRSQQNKVEKGIAKTELKRQETAKQWKEAYQKFSSPRAQLSRQNFTPGSHVDLEEGVVKVADQNPKIGKFGAESPKLAKAPKISEESPVRASDTSEQNPRKTMRFKSRTIVMIPNKDPPIEKLIAEKVQATPKKRGKVPTKIQPKLSKQLSRSKS